MSIARFASFTLFAVLVGFGLSKPGSAQDGPADTVGVDVPFDVRVIDEMRMRSDGSVIALWGIDKIYNKTMILNLKARKALEDKIGGAPVLCDVMGYDEAGMIAQCTNSLREDLSLFLLQEGFVHVDRDMVRDTIYEKPYLAAESSAFDNKRGVWEKDIQTLLEDNQKSERYFAIITFVVMTVFVLALSILGLMVIRRFAGVVDVQSRSLDLAERERELKDREKYVLASMIFSEIRENKDKIEAYILIYEEGLRALQDSSKIPQYQSMGGDTIQKQPSLNRGVFDGNTNKLDLLGSKFASELIHYYARIKSVPDYVDIKPDEDRQVVQELFESSIEHARKLSEMSSLLSLSFIERGLVDEIRS